MGFAVAAGISGFLAVAAGAFGAHALRERLTPELLQIWQTAALYHLVHSAALLGAAWQHTRAPSGTTTLAGWAFVAGVVVFSGSLYALALSGVRGLGAITPLGGVAFLVGWAAVAWSAWRG